MRASLLVNGERRVADIWDTVGMVTKYPEVKEDLLMLSARFDMVALPTSTELVKCIDPTSRAITSGYWDGWFWGTLPWRSGGSEQRLGSYVAMGDSEFTLLVFVFTRPGYKKQGTDICWRGYVIPNNGATVIELPPKDDGSSNSYRQGPRGFGLFVGDIKKMLASAYHWKP